MKKGINPELLVIIFFILLLLVGIYIFKDYGSTWDEPRMNDRGKVNFEYMFNKNISLPSEDHGNNDHGPFIEMVLYESEKRLNLKDVQEIYLMRHFFSFVIFYVSIIFFYLLCKGYFKNWKMGLLGSIFLVLSPIIFGNSFYNTKDLGFLSLFIISVYTLTKFLEKRSFSRSFFHALACAIATDVRIIGILIPVVTLFILIFENTSIKSVNKIKKDLKYFLFFSLFLIIFIILFWPSLWNNPFKFISFFLSNANFSWDNTVKYLGKSIPANKLPWTYIPLWIMISTPILYLILFILGILTLTKDFIKNKWKKYTLIQKEENLVFLIWFFLPIMAVIILKSTLYNSWRQLFFVYPTLLVIGLIGLERILNFFKNKRLFKILIIILISFCLIYTAIEMINNHPYEYVYFNILAGNNTNIGRSFDRDYWGISYLQAFKELLKRDNSSTIKMCGDYPGLESINLLNSSERGRISFVNCNHADYYITNYAWDNEEDFNYTEFFSIKVEGLKIVTLFKLR